MQEYPVLVTGGAGYIGSHVVLALRAAGRAVTVLDDLSNGRREAVARSAAFVEGDAGDGGFVERLLAERGIRAVVHMAARISVPESVRDPLGYYRANSGVTGALLGACVAAGVRHVVYSSTAAVYGAPAANPIAEDAPTLPVNPYGASKLVGEWMLRDTAAAHGLRYAALRYFNVAGADPRGRAGPSDRAPGHLVTAACDAALGRRGPLTLFGTDYDTPDGTCVRDYVHVADIADAHAAALRLLEGGGRGGVFNCGHGRGISVREAMAAVEAESGRRLDVRAGPRRPGDAAALVADISRIRAELGWRPRRDLRAMARTALAWRKRLGRAGAPDA